MNALRWTGVILWLPFGLVADYVRQCRRLGRLASFYEWLDEE